MLYGKVEQFDVVTSMGCIKEVQAICHTRRKTILCLIPRTTVTSLSVPNDTRCKILFERVIFRIMRWRHGRSLSLCETKYSVSWLIHTGLRRQQTEAKAQYESYCVLALFMYVCTALYKCITIIWFIIELNLSRQLSASVVCVLHCA